MHFINVMTDTHHLWLKLNIWKTNSLQVLYCSRFGWGSQLGQVPVKRAFNTIKVFVQFFSPNWIKQKAFITEIMRSGETWLAFHIKLVWKSTRFFELCNWCYCHCVWNVQFNWNGCCKGGGDRGLSSGN